MSSNLYRKVVIGWLGVSVSLLSVLSVLWAFYLYTENRELPVLDASLSLPTQATLDSTVIMVITTTNTHTKPLILGSIDVGDSFLEGFQVVKIQPSPSATEHLYYFRRWDFGQTVDPGATLQVRFELKAVLEGHFSGDIDVCNPNLDYKTLLADVVVRKEFSIKLDAGGG